MAIVASDLFASSPLLDIVWNLDLRRGHCKQFWWSISEMGFEAVGELAKYYSSDGTRLSYMLTMLINDKSIASDGQ